MIEHVGWFKSLKTDLGLSNLGVFWCAGNIGVGNVGDSCEIRGKFFRVYIETEKGLKGRRKEWRGSGRLWTKHKKKKKKIYWFIVFYYYYSFLESKFSSFFESLVVTLFQVFSFFLHFLCFGMLLGF